MYYFRYSFFGGGAQNKLERLPSQLDSFAIRQFKRVNGFTLRRYPLFGGWLQKNLGEKRVSPVRLPKQEYVNTVS